MPILPNYRWFRAFCLFAALLYAASAIAQSDLDALEQKLKGKPLELRNYSADPIARYSWADGKLVAGAVQNHTLAIFTADSLKLKGGKIVIRGWRSTLVGDIRHQRLATAGRAPMQLEVDLRATELAIALRGLEDALFFPDAKAAIDALPVQIAQHIPYDISGAKPVGCDCFRYFENRQWNTVPRNDPKLIQPKVIEVVDPEYSEEARENKTTGTVVVAFFVSNAGSVADVWIAKPLGFGLDEKAEEAVEKYRFAPAQYDGRPVGIQLSTSVLFQTF